MIEAEQLHARILEKLDLTREVEDEELTGIIYQVLQEAGQKEIIGIRKYQPSAFGSGKSAITGITGSSALFGKENLHIRPIPTRKMSKVHNIRGTVIICHDNLHIVPGRNGIETPLQQARYVLMGNND